MSDLPEGWTRRPLFDLVRPATGQVSPRYEPYASMTLVAPDHIESETGRLIAKRSAADQGAISGKYIFKPGDVVYSKIRPYLRKAFLADFDGLCSADMYPLSPRGETDARFLLATLLGHAFSVFAESASARSGIPKINRDELAEFSVAAPPPAEQRAIAATLSDIDALLAKLDQLIAKKRDLKQAAMQQLLTSRTRLPGFADVWRDVTIGDVADVKTGPFGSSLHESDYVDNGTPIITVEHLGERSITRQNLPMVSDEDCRRLRAYSLQPGDVVFSRVGSIDRNALVTESESGWLFSGRLLRVRVRRDGADPAFLSHQFHSEPFKQRVREVAVGQTMPSLNTQILRRLPVALPTLVEQRAIAQVLSEMDTELTALEARLEKTRQLKQGMMQALLTGRIRLGPAPAGEAQSGC